MAGWRRRWLVHLQWQSSAVSPTGHCRQTVEVWSPLALRRVQLAALTDPQVITYRTVALPVWDSTGDPTTCPQGDELVPAGVSDVDCRCGGHRRYRCHRDGWEQICPPVGPDCAAPVTG